jgi:hypothetical protein
MRCVLSVLYCSLLAFVLFGGCESSGRKTVASAASGKGGESAGADKFPAFLAGTWQAQDAPWQVVLTPDGTVDSAVVAMAEARVRPNQTTEFEMLDGSISHITAGELFAEYRPAGRQLFVSIELKDIHIVFPDDLLKGNTIDNFTGTVSEDGRTWNAEHITIFDYGPRFPQVPDDVNYPTPIVFNKVEEKAQVADSNAVRQ